MPEITLKCFVIGETLNKTFKIGISTGDTVSELRARIWNKKLNDFTNDYRSQLKLWKVEISPQDKEKREILRSRDRYTSDLEGTELLPDDIIMEYWPRKPKENCIHVVVKGRLD